MFPKPSFTNELTRVRCFICMIGISLIWMGTSCQKAQKKQCETKIIRYQVSSKQYSISVLPAYQEMTFHADSLANSTELRKFDSIYSKAQKEIIAALNRLDISRLSVGRYLVIPDTFYAQLLRYAPFPARLAMADSIPQLILVSLRVQAFAMYENGILIRWGPVSTGKQSTPTPPKLYYCNYKSKRKISTVSDEWIMPWYFNIDNFNGIGLHQFTLPGYPASHTCIRMYEEDAQFNFHWSRQWQLSGDSVVKHGTPVIIFGTYHFDRIKPWRNLIAHPHDNRLFAIELQEIGGFISIVKQ